MAVRADHSSSSVNYRTCNQCEIEKPLTEFRLAVSRGSQHYRRTCKQCTLLQRKKHPNYEQHKRNSALQQKNHPDRLQRSRARDAKRELSSTTCGRARKLKCRYGLTLEEYNALVFTQSGLCASCQNLTNPLYVDHDHSTGMVRGLLCKNCNLALGNLFDDPKRAQGLLKYIIEYVI